MITYKPIVAPNSRRKDGTYPVKIRVTYKGIVRRLPTTLVCYSNDLTRTCKIKNATILDKANELIKRMRDVTDNISPFDLEDRDVDWVVLKIKEGLKQDSFRLDFFEFGDKYILTKSGTTRNAYSTALNTLERFLGKRELDVNDITRLMLLDFMEYVDNLPKMYYDHQSGEVRESKKAKIAKAASSRHLMKLANIFNAAKSRYNDEDSERILIPKSPFDKIERHFPHSQGQRSIGAETMQRLISYQTDNQNMRWSLDLFIISFGLMGANMADLFYAKPFSETWVYNRQKTRSRRADQAETRVEIPAELKPYISRLRGRGGWWLNELHGFADDKDYATDRVNRYLKKWCEDNDVPVFTFYAARHTFATLARSAGIEKATIDDCLVHKGDFSVTDIYAEKNWELMQEANRKVIEMFIW